MGRENSKERRKRKERDEIRLERCRIRERERRIADAGMNEFKHSKLIRDRDISEQIALGIAKVSRSTNEALYDQRLFDKESGLQSGFAEDSNYDLYDKPLFA